MDSIKIIRFKLLQDGHLSHVLFLKHANDLGTHGILLTSFSFPASRYICSLCHQGLLDDGKTLGQLQDK